MLYTFLLTQYRLRQKASAPVHLPTDADNEEDLLAPRLIDGEDAPKDLAAESAPGGTQPMHGRLYLLLWLPAACDLTGTTVSTSPPGFLIPCSTLR